MLILILLRLQYTPDSTSPFLTNSLQCEQVHAETGHKI